MRRLALARTSPAANTPRHAGLEHQRVAVERPLPGPPRHVGAGQDEPLVVHREEPGKRLGARSDADEDEQRRQIHRRQVAVLRVPQRDLFEVAGAARAAQTSTSVITSMFWVASIRSMR